MDGDLRMKSAAPQECHRDKGGFQDRRPVAHRKSTVLLESIVTIYGHIADIVMSTVGASSLVR